MTEREIFIGALQLEDQAQRQSFLNEACAGQSQLRVQVENLLGLHHGAGRFLEKPADNAASPLTIDQPIFEQAGMQIGPYKLLQQIGEGGMGVVYMAEQTEPVRRRVALKIIKPGMDTRQVIARFEAERQALAMMDHVNIARVLDAGATELGRPYFVMELVHGVPITQYCDDHRLAPRQRLELFVPVCQAIQHAHQKGVIHRDIKPSNVMITLYDGKPVPKVIDFGVAKATEQKLTERTLFTQYGTLVGTLEYMSPEQAEMSALGADTRSDIFSLGVLLYELLAGSTPLSSQRVKETAYSEILRIIKEEEPPKPSTRLSGLGKALESISALRHTEPAKLTKLVRGELDWIVMKCLEKDRNRRYDTANALAADVQRYLNDETVLACPPTATYQFRKFARRHKAALATASVLGLAALLAVAVLAISTLLIARTLQRERRDSYFHRVTLADRELSAFNLGRAIQLLDQCPQDLREWEWYYLQRLCGVDPITLRGSGKGIRGVTFSPDGRLLAAANEDGSVVLFDLETAAEIRTLRGHAAKVFSVAFHPQGKRIASASADRTVKVWDLKTSQVVFSLDGNEGTHAGGSSAVAFSSDGRLLAAGSDHGSVIVCDASDGRIIKRLSEHERMAVCVAFSPDNRLLATGSWTGTLRLWNVATGDLLWFKEFDDRPMGAMAFSPDGRFLATAGYDRFVRLWDVPTGNLIRSWRGHEGIIPGLSFSRPDGKRLATIGGEDKSVKLWDPQDGREILNLRGHSLFGECVVFSPDGQRMASSALDGTIRIWDASPVELSERQELMTLNHSDEVWSVAISPDGQRIASSSFDKFVRLWDSATGVVVHTLGLPSQGYMLAFSRDGGGLAAISRDKTARIWETSTGLLRSGLATANNHLFGVTFSPDGQFLLVDDVGGIQLKEGESHAITVWDAQAGQASPKVIGIVGRHGEDIWCLKFNPEGNCLASGSNDGSVKLWSWDSANPGQSREPLHVLPVRLYGFGDCVAFSSNGERLITAAEEHAVKIWDAKTGSELLKLNGHTGDVIAVAVSPDGRWLASAGEDTTIILWDAVNLSNSTPALERRHTLRGHKGMVMSLAFSPDSRRLVSGSRDHTVKVWDVTRWAEVQER